MFKPGDKVLFTGRDNTIKLNRGDVYEVREVDGDYISLDKHTNVRFHHSLFTACKRDIRVGVVFNVDDVNYVALKDDVDAEDGILAVSAEDYKIVSIPKERISYVYYNQPSESYVIEVLTGAVLSKI